MGMILIPAFLFLAMLIIVICVLVFKASKEKSGGLIVSAICLAVVCGLILWYIILPFYIGY
ncbi:hypothetical protein BIY28_02225 [Brenneria goodwinii]|uniref:Inner membrane protein n=1 Tax=Brenneria goodwinii TaxID=1109412 RepID=A0A0G4K1C3_9GAMM|nr:hypothetical protein BIY28_02225 [Brenneria goodwinii]CPR20637.1 hypothetical protein BN1221_04429c [Brenneria goodwinii]